MTERIENIPMVPLRGMTVLPREVIHFDVSRKRSIEAIQKVMAEDQKIFLVTQREIETEEVTKEDLYETGTIAEIKQIVKMPKKILRVLVTGKERAVLNALFDTEAFYQADVTVTDSYPYVEAEPVEQEAMVRTLREQFLNFAMRNPHLTKETVEQINQLEELKILIDEVTAASGFSYQDKQKFLDEANPLVRYQMLIQQLANETEVLKVKEEIQEKVKARVDKGQREYILREELRVIRQELGDDSFLSDAEEFERMTDELLAPQEVKDKLYKEIKRFKNTMGSPSESGVIRTYIETMLEMPWDKVSEDNLDIGYAKEILEAEHYGLEKVKDRILEFLAVRALTSKGNSPILCLVGPPGTGKTSIARSLAKALHKKYVRISLGGVRDEAEIRGHRKTYVGAMPGRIANGLKTAGVKNPLLLLDEIDKVSTDYKGDTFSALLEVLDSEQNVKFRDHYLEVPLDLSEVLFVTTANTLQTIPRPLLDRMEVIEISSYTDNEKLHIAERHLIPKQLEKHGLSEEQLTISKGALWKMTHNYTREAGVRQLERQIGNICRKAAREILEEKKERIRITESSLAKYLGKELYVYQMANETDEVGIVRGLAWTSVGGDTLQIEVNTMPGKGELTLTGQMGDVMKESARTGISYIRSIVGEYGIEPEYFEKHDIHIHIPEGAVPKDGPSAGISMATANFSAITNQKVRADVAMTGEITLRGRVLPIGGLKEKLLAAKIAGIRTVIVPAQNQKDVQELSSEITKGLEIRFVSQMREVLEIALVKE